MENNKNSLHLDAQMPEIGKRYHFFDDGKTSNSRHYIATCMEIITPEEAKSLIFELDGRETIEDAPLLYTISLLDLWKKEVEGHYWLFAKETDFFVGCLCPEFDDNELWFVRTKDGGWFSMDIQGLWQGGRLDVDFEIHNRMVKEVGEDYYRYKI